VILRQRGAQNLRVVDAGCGFGRLDHHGRRDFAAWGLTTPADAPGRSPERPMFETLRVGSRRDGQGCRLAAAALCP